MSVLLRYKQVTTRKPHVCFGCGREFMPPTKMVAAASADGGHAESYYLCETCDGIVGNMHYDEEYGFGDLLDEALQAEEAEATYE